MDSKTNIETLQDLREAVGEETVERIVTEYLMELIADRALLEKIRSVVSRNGSMKEIRELL